MSNGNKRYVLVFVNRESSVWFLRREKTKVHEKDRALAPLFIQRKTEYISCLICNRDNGITIVCLGRRAYLHKTASISVQDRNNSIFGFQEVIGIIGKS